MKKSAYEITYVYEEEYNQILVIAADIEKAIQKFKKARKTGKDYEKIISIQVLDPEVIA